MNTNRKQGWLIGMVLGATVLSLGALPAMADSKDRRGPGNDRGRPAATSRGGHDGRDGRNDRDRDRDRRDDRGRDHGSNDRIGFRVSFGDPVYRPVVQRVWVAESYIERIEQVCVEPEHYVTRRIPEVVEKRFDKFGNPYFVVVRPARQERILVPARYESRVVRVCVPGHYEEVVTHRPSGGTRISIGGIFDF